MWARCLRRLATSRNLIRTAFTVFPPVALRSLTSFHYSEDEKNSFELPERPIQLPEHEFSHAFLVRQSCVMSSEAAATMLTQVVMAIEDGVSEYVRCMSELANLYEDSVIALTEEGTQISTNLTKKCSDLRKTTSGMEVLFHFVRKLMEANAEACFLAGAEFASVQASERLHSAASNVGKLFEGARLAELELAKAHAKHIELVDKALRAIQE